MAAQSSSYLVVTLVDSHQPMVKLRLTTGPLTDFQRLVLNLNWLVSLRPMNGYRKDGFAHLRFVGEKASGRAVVFERREKGTC